MHQHPVQLLAFIIDRQRFGIQIGQVDEVIRVVRLVRLPNAPKIVEGLIDLRGKIVPVVDIRCRFRMTPKPLEPTDHLVIARASERVVALRVDRAADILTLAAHQIEDIGAVAPASEYVAGVAKLPDGLLLIHDLASLLSDAEAEALDDLAPEGPPA